MIGYNIMMAVSQTRYLSEEGPRVKAIQNKMVLGHVVCQQQGWSINNFWTQKILSDEILSTGPLVFGRIKIRFFQKRVERHNGNLYVLLLPLLLDTSPFKENVIARAMM